jgi:glycosyltransferase involved in cell wall biosynthesis
MMAGLDVLTVTSREDAFPLVVLEAMALRVPVVAFDVGGVREELGPTGVLIPASDVEAMADAVVDLLEDQPHRQRLAEAAAVRVEQTFDISGFHRAVCAIVARELDEVSPRETSDPDAGPT